VRGKFIYCGGEKLFIRGVTYGTFRPTLMAMNSVARNGRARFRFDAPDGVNAVRTYTPPPHWLLDAAQRHGC